MTHEEKITNLQVAAAIVGYNFDRKGLDLLVTIYEKVLLKKGKTDLKDLIDIHIEIDRKYKEKELTNG